MKIKKFIPNILTFANLGCGFISIIFIFEDKKYFEILVLIIIAAIFDLLDGFFARIFNVSNNIGKNLDSLSDIITFGLVPSILIYNHLYKYSNINLIPYAAFIILACSAYRLAVFNSNSSKNNDFKGVPTPFNAILIVSILSLRDFSTDDKLIYMINNPYFIIILTLLSSLLLISKIPIMSMKIDMIDPKKDKMKIIFILLSIILFMSFYFFSIPIILILYIIFSFLKKN